MDRPYSTLFIMCCVCVAVCFKFALPSFQLRSGGSQILEGCIAEIPNISSLDISDNGEMAASILIVLMLEKGPQHATTKIS